MKFFIKMLALFLACLGSGALPLQAKVVDRVIAVVNGDVVTEYDLDRAMAPLGDRHRSAEPGLTTENLRRHILDELINQKLLEQEIEKANIEVSDDELSSAIANVLQKNRINIEILRAELSAKGITFEAYKDQLRLQIRQAKFIQQNLASNVHITDDDVRRYHVDHLISPDQQMTVHLASIFLPLDEGASSEDLQKLVRKGHKLTDRARKGEDWAKLGKGAKEEGEKSLADLPAPVAAEVRNMEIGSVSDPIVSPQGVYIVKLKERLVAEADKPRPVEETGELKASLYNDRMEQEINSYVLRLRKKAYIDIRE